MKKIDSKRNELGRFMSHCLQLKLPYATFIFYSKKLILKA